MCPLVTQLLNEMSPISLKDMDDVRLMNRIDTKYVIHAEYPRASKVLRIPPLGKLDASGSC